MMESTTTLVQDGKSLATIVVARDIGTTAVTAVHDLVQSIAKMSGAALPVVNDGEQADGGTQVHVGRTAFVDRAGLLPPDLPANGYHLATLNEGSSTRFVIAGNHPVGVSHGIYDFLTNTLGVIWGMADPLFEDVPVQATVKVGTMDRIERPAFSFRCLVGNDIDWLRRNRTDVALSSRPFIVHWHNLNNIIPASKYSDHPEYYALVDGKRLVPDSDHYYQQPCMTHPDVIRIAIETARAHFDASPENGSFSLCPNDSNAFCECPECAALDDGMEHYRDRDMHSDSHFHFVNAVATELLKTHPDRFLSTYAYWGTELPPRNIAKLPPNVAIYLTQDSSQYFDPEYEKRDLDLLRAWSKVADTLCLYEYYGLSWYVGRYYPSIISRTIPFLPSVNVKGFWCESYPHWAHFGPMLYLSTRLLWDTRLDAQAVLDEWFERMFREAANQMKAFYGVLEDNWMNRPRVGHWFQGLECLWQQLLQWTPDAREAAWQRINEAYDAATSSIVRQRVDYVRRGHRVGYLVSLAHEAAHALEPGMNDSEKAIVRVTDLVREALASLHTAIESDPTYGAAYYRGSPVDFIFDWWKCDIGLCLKKTVAGSAELRTRLLTEDPTFAELAGKAADPELLARWEHENKRMLSLELYR